MIINLLFIVGIFTRHIQICFDNRNICDIVQRRDNFKINFELFQSLFSV